VTRSDDPHDLQRFVEAQDPVIDEVKRELRSGRKQSHWMWFVFPQTKGLGSSRLSKRYAISSTAEAEAYLDHPKLGRRLRECTGIVNGLDADSANAVFGSPDDLKFRSSMTLFESVADEPTPFTTALRRYFDGDRDSKTLELLEEL